MKHLARFERAFKSDETVLEPGGWYGPVKMGKSIYSIPKTIELYKNLLSTATTQNIKNIPKAIRNDYHVTLRSLMELNYPVGGGIPIEEG